MRAYTLIEVLIAITIISIVSSIMLVDFSGARVGRDVEGLAREVAGAFREAQNYALTGRQGVAGTNPCRFDIAWGGSAYSVTYRYKDGSGDCTQSSVIRSYQLRNGVTFSSSSGYYFTLPHANTFELDNAPVSVSKMTPLAKAGTSYVVCTYANGLINHYAGTTCPSP